MSRQSQATAKAEKRKQDNYFTVANNDGTVTDGRWALTVKRGEIKTIRKKSIEKIIIIK